MKTKLNPTFSNFNRVFVIHLISHCKHTLIVMMTHGRFFTPFWRQWQNNWYGWWYAPSLAMADGIHRLLLWTSL